MGESTCCVGSSTPQKRIVEQLTIIKNVNGYTVSGYPMQNHVFLTLRESLEFIEKTIGNEVR